MYSIILYSLLFITSIVQASTCSTYTVVSGDTCYSVGQAHSVSSDKIISYNQNHVGWFGCDKLKIGQVVCVSSGDAPSSDYECGQNVACPINACCSTSGYCGLTNDYCTSDNCISNCGVPTFPSGSSSSYSRGTFWLDSSSISIDSTYDTIFYGFATISSDLSSILTSSNFDEFVNYNFKGKKILSLGGNAFSTSSSTYQVFRNAIKKENREAVGKVIADFVKANNLNGVNFDWEYPGELDISGIPAGSSTDGANYSGLVQTVKNDLGSAYSVSVCIPASFWYLKHFPLSTMKSYIDYFILMSYDYNGQWDYGKSGTGLGCHVDQTLTVSAISMLNKAGVPMSKIRGGLASYGRSYKLSHTSCITYGCSFTGPNSGATAGSKSKTPGILYSSEIESLSGNSQFNSTSKCFRKVYNSGTEWVAWMKESDRGYLESDVFKKAGLSGSVLWAINYNA